jgi:gamma-glutamyltranspeptidase / glutathione hydrolase
VRFDSHGPLVRSAVLIGVACLALPACRNPRSSLRPPDAPPQRGAVVAEHPLAVAAGVAILDAGGNAADAAVAAALVLAVVYPQAGNLGGGGFALFTPHEGESEVLDFREVAPAGYTADLYLDADGRLDPSRSIRSPLAVGVPGSPAGMFELFRRHGSGRFSFEELGRAAVSLARNGFPVDPWLARDLRREQARSRLCSFRTSRELFYPGGEPLSPGDLLVQPDLAKTLDTYLRGGPRAFYRGRTASNLLATMRTVDALMGNLAGDGLMTSADLQDYSVILRQPLQGWFRGNQVITAGPPSSGGIVLLQVLSVLDGFPLDAERVRALEAAELGLDPAVDGAGVSASAAHWWIEALRRAFADRAMHLGDPGFVQVPTDELLSPSWIAERRVSIGERAAPDVAAWVEPPPPESTETTHISVLDDQGNAVSLTTTLNASFGSGIMVEGSGFLLNNELDDFSILPGAPNLYGLVGSQANQLAPGRRPLSSMTPTIVREGGRGVTLVIGAPGGPRIITAVTQVLLRVLAYDQSLEDAVRAPRLHQQWNPKYTRFEGGWPGDLVAALENRHGHEIKLVADGRFASVQAIYVNADGEPTGVSDPRRGGVAGIQGLTLPVPAGPLEFDQDRLTPVVGP